MVSQAIPMALMGIPGIYIHSLLGSRNDYEGVKQTGRARSINREQLQVETLRAELADPASIRAQVFSAYRNLLGLRAKQSAFDPSAAQQILDLGASVFAVRRENAKTGQILIAIHNVTDKPIEIKLGTEAYLDLLSSDRLSAGVVSLAPYQVRWLQ